MKKDNEISRREFLHKIGLGALTVGAAGTGCNPRRDAIDPAGVFVDTDSSQMTYRVNHNNGDKVSLLGYGCMRWPMMPNPDGEGEIIDQEQTNRLVDYAIAHGVNYFDTAPPYIRGLSEEATGIALSRHPRSSYFIATKLSNPRIANQYDDPKIIREKSIEMYQNSFKRLRTDYIDYYLLHNLGGGNGIPFVRKRFFDNHLIDFLLDERKAGRIRNLGFSYHGDIKVFDYMLSMHDTIHWDFVQIQLNYVDYRHASGANFNADYLYSELEKRNIPAIIMEPLLGGRLATLHDNLNAILKAKRPTDSIASWAFRFAGTYPGVLTVLSGMTYMENLQDNLKTYSPLEPLNEEEFETLETIAQKMVQYPLIPCNTCQYCMPCPYGLDIPAIFSHYNKCINEGNVSSSVNDINYARARRAFLVGYDRSVPKLRQASHCIGCGKCMHHCPQRINIPEQMRRVDKYVESLKQNNLGDDK